MVDLADLETFGELLRAFRKRRSEEHTSELQSQSNLVCRLLLEKKNDNFASHYQNWPNDYQGQHHKIRLKILNEVSKSQDHKLEENGHYTPLYMQHVLIHADLTV